MNIWIFVWVVLAVFVLGVFFWSMEILFKQKRGWKKFSQSLNLNFQEQALLVSPVVEGNYKNFHITLYSEEQMMPESGRRQYRTVIVLAFLEGFPTGGAVATRGRREFVESLKVEEVHKPDFKGWNGSIVFHTQDDEVMTSFMNEDRYKSLQRLMNLKGKETIFIFDDKEAYYRLETADPMDDPVVLEKMVMKLMAECDVLRPTNGDKKLFKATKKKKAPSKKKKEDESEVKSDLKLEDD